MRSRSETSEAFELPRRTDGAREEDAAAQRRSRLAKGDKGDEGVAGRRRGGTSTGEGTLLMLDIEQDRRLSNVDSVVVSVKDPMLAAQSLSCPDRR